MIGKKATESDIILSHRKLDDTIFSFIYAIDDKWLLKTQILVMVNIADLEIIE